MSSTYTPSLTLTQIGNGEQSGTWGTTTNNNWQLIEDAVAGVASVSVSGTSGATLSVANGATDQSRKAVIIVTGATSGTNAIIAPLQPKVYLVSNQTTGGFPITIGASTGSVVTIASGLTTLVYCDGTNFNSGITGFTGGNLSITGTINASGTITAPVINANLYGGVFGNIPVQLSSSSTGYISAPPSSGVPTFLSYNPATPGFSWQASSTTASNINGGGANQLVYQTNSNSTSFISAPTTPGQILNYNGSQIVWTSGGAVSSVSGTGVISSTGGTSPVISLSGVVPVANGGTGATSSTGSGANVLANSPNLTTPNTVGVTDGSNAAAGYVGEYISSNVSSISVSANTNTPLTSITLSAGDWDVSGFGYSNNNGYSAFNIAVSTSPTTFTNSIGIYESTSVGPISFSVIPTRFNITGTQTIYLMIRLGGGSGPYTDCGGQIEARRMR